MKKISVILSILCTLTLGHTQYTFASQSPERPALKIHTAAVISKGPVLSSTEFLPILTGAPKTRQTLESLLAQADEHLTLFETASEFNQKMHLRYAVIAHKKLNDTIAQIILIEPTEPIEDLQKKTTAQQQKINRCVAYRLESNQRKEINRCIFKKFKSLLVTIQKKLNDFGAHDSAKSNAELSLKNEIENFNNWMNDNNDTIKKILVDPRCTLLIAKFKGLMNDTLLCFRDLFINFEIKLQEKIERGTEEKWLQIINELYKNVEFLTQSAILKNLFTPEMKELLLDIKQLKQDLIEDILYVKRGRAQLAAIYSQNAVEFASDFPEPQMLQFLQDLHHQIVCKACIEINSQSKEQHARIAAFIAGNAQPLILDYLENLNNLDEVPTISPCLLSSIDMTVQLLELLLEHKTKNKKTENINLSKEEYERRENRKSQNRLFMMNKYRITHEFLLKFQNERLVTPQQHTLITCKMAEYLS